MIKLWWGRNENLAWARGGEGVSGGKDKQISGYWERVPSSPSE